MRGIRKAQFVAATLALILGSSVVAVSAAQSEEALPLNGVSGTVALDRPVSLGGFSVDEGIHQHRDIPVTGSQVVADDARLNGRLEAVFNYDVHRSGTQPVPAWGTISIDDGAWTGTFTGLRRQDFEPFSVRAFLVGEGPYAGLCAVLDIEAGTDSWDIDGVIHPLPMGA